MDGGGEVVGDGLEGAAEGVHGDEGIRRRVDEWEMGCEGGQLGGCARCVWFLN